MHSDNILTNDEVMEYFFQLCLFLQVYLAKTYIVQLTPVVRFRSATTQTVIIVVFLTTIYIFNYCYVYLVTPFDITTSDQQENDATFVPYTSPEWKSTKSVYLKSVLQGLY